MTMRTMTMRTMTMRWMPRGLAALALVGLLALGACRAEEEPTEEPAAPNGSEMGEVTGSVTFEEDVEIPAGSTAKISLQDTSLQDVAATVIDTMTVNDPGSFPIAYRLVYDSAEILESNTYTVSARIEDEDGTLLFINDTSIQVITRDNPTEDVEIPVIGVGAPPAAATAVTGEVTYMVRMALPPDAVTTVQLLDVSIADAPATVLDEQVTSDGAQVPIPFVLSYEESDIDPRHLYTVHARIVDGEGNLMFISTQAYPVITRGNPTQGVQVMVQPAVPPDHDGESPIDPTVTLSPNPSKGVTGEKIDFYVNASDGQGGIAKLELLKDGEVIDTWENPEPSEWVHHTFVWREAEKGAFDFTSKAYDLDGGVGTSPVERVTVKDAAERTAEAGDGGEEATEEAP